MLGRVVDGEVGPAERTDDDLTTRVDDDDDEVTFSDFTSTCFVSTSCSVLGLKTGLGRTGSIIAVVLTTLDVCWVRGD